MWIQLQFTVALLLRRVWRGSSFALLALVIFWLYSGFRLAAARHFRGGWKCDRLWLCSCFCRRIFPAAYKWRHGPGPGPRPGRVVPATISAPLFWPRVQAPPPAFCGLIKILASRCCSTRLPEIARKKSGKLGLTKCFVSAKIWLALAGGETLERIEKYCKQRVKLRTGVSSHLWYIFWIL